MRKFAKFVMGLALLIPVSAISQETPEFTPLFDGKSLDGWEGDSRFWKVQDESIIGETTSEVQPSANTFLIYRGGEFQDFELRFQYQVEGYNSGVQYRSRELGNFGMAGLQADFEARWHDGDIDKFTGMLYDEKGRKFLAQRGEMVSVGEKKAERIASLGDSELLGEIIQRDDWNDYTILARGETVTHIINGRVMMVAMGKHLLQDGAGLLGFQLHKGKPMKIQLRNIKIRK